MRNKSIIKTDDTMFFHRRDKELIEGIKRLREVSLSNRKNFDRLVKSYKEKEDLIFKEILPQ